MESNASITFRLNSISSITTAANVVAAGRWDEVTATYDLEKQRIYINGVLAAETNFTAGLSSGSADTYIGNNSAKNRPFSGKIDELSILNMTFRNATDYVSGGSGTVTDPWVGPNSGGGIKAAINSLPAVGKGIIYCPTGHYDVNDVLFDTKTNIVIEGDGASTVLRRIEDTNTYTVAIAVNNDWSLRDFALDGNRYNRIVNLEGIRINGKTRVVIDNVDIEDCSITGIMVYDNSSYIDITECYFTNDYYGVWLEQVNNIASLTVDNCTMMGDQMTPVQFNIVSNANDIVVSNNYVGPYDRFGISLAEMDNVTVTGNTVASSTSDGEAYNNAIHLEVGVNIDITNNIASNSRGAVIDISSNDPGGRWNDNVLVQGNTVTFEGTGPFGAITVSQQSKNITVKGNTVTINDSNGSGQGLYVFDNVYYLTVEDNLFDGGWRGIRVVSSNWTTKTNKGFRIIDNDVYNSRSQGISITDLTDDVTMSNRIWGNVVTNCGTGIEATGNGSVSIWNNGVADCTGDGVYTSIKADIKHNTVVSNTGYGINLAGSSVTSLNNIFANNTSYQMHSYSSGQLTSNYSEVYGTNRYSNVTAGANDLNSDPLLATDNIHLTSSSPCKDAGTNASITTDFEGDSRPGGNGYDIGADEFY